jgi:hypothetical protein
VIPEVGLLTKRIPGFFQAQQLEVDDGFIKAAEKPLFSFSLAR